MSCTNIAQFEQQSHFFHVSGVATRQDNTAEFATGGTMETTCAIYFDTKGL
jgi:hypothetical protein